MAVVYTDRERYPDFETEVGAVALERDELLSRSDIVTVHVPSTPETRGSFDMGFFSRMKRGSFFINTARGDVVDEEALLEALNQGVLAGAGLDVFPHEPDVNPRLVQDPRVVALPHIGSATTHTRRAMAELAVRNAVAVLRGDPPVTPVTK
jgi:glyoxylate reductase